MKKKILIVFGTRPEAIKMAPVIKELEKYRENFDVKICVTAQHRELLDEVLNIFQIKPDFDLNIMKEGQDLYDITSRVLLGMRDILREFKPDLVLVHGDTTTSVSAALASFYEKIPVGHVEAGLRTWDIKAPWPEEMNRQVLDRIAQIYFVPTENAKQNLLKENTSPEKIHIVGNTEIDALLWITKNQKGSEEKMFNELKSKYGIELNSSKKIILVTAHRRESFGEGLKNICEALKEIASKRDDIVIIYPVHPNPNVQKTAHEILDNQKNIFLTSPITYEVFALLMNKSYLILTDSGGIQESAPSLNKPLLVMREKTERQEGVEAGVSRLVGTDKEKIVLATIELLENKEIYNAMINKENPYGDGKAAERIVKIFRE